MSSQARVLVTGASGRMAREVIAAVSRDPKLALVGAVSRGAIEAALPLPDGRRIPLTADLEQGLACCDPDVVVDFTHPAATPGFARAAIARGVAMVIGTTGLGAAEVAELEELCRRQRVGAVLAPNFSLGAVLLMHLARRCAPFFEYAEIIEMHHEQKSDAPSGTALATAQGMARARGQPFRQEPIERETLAGTRGGTVEGITIHSVRLPGLMAHQEVILGGLGQTLTLRHDSISRESFMPGVLLAIRAVRELDHLVVGLEPLLGLTEP